jgi:hypothetical protein
MNYKKKLFGLYHGANAFCTKDFLDLVPVFNHSNFLQIRLKRAIGCSQRKTAVMTEGRSFATGVTLCHFVFPFLTIIAKLGKI